MGGVAIALGALAFLSELVLWGGMGYAVFRLTSGAGTVVAVVAGIAAALAMIVFWSLLMAPRAPHRFSAWQRFVVIAVAFSGLGALLATVGMPRAALSIALAGIAITALAESTIKLG